MITQLDFFESLNYKKCFECESTGIIHEHHVIPRSLGGKKTIPLCSICHSKIHQRNLTRMSELSKIGMMKAREKGIKFGRPLGSKNTPQNMLENHYDIVSLLKQGMSVRQTAKKTNKGFSTVQRVKKLLKSKILD
jgi:uncharacterized protein YerC